MNYWVVGAMFGGTDDQYATFMRRGYWYCWDPRRNDEIPADVQSRFAQIQQGDRIAVKRLLGRGATDMEVRAIGVVKDIDQGEWRVYVNWLLTDLTRKAPLHGCAASIHGPFQADDEWVRQVFQL
jgi:hypothetical protein